MNQMIRGLALAAACVVSAVLPAGAEDLPKVRIQAVEGSVGGVPLMIMKNEGLDRKFGFDGEFEFLPGDSAAQNLLIGKTDISMDNDIIGVSVARAEGFEITAFYPVGNLYLGIVVPGDSPAKTPADLKGKAVGYFGADSGTTMFIRSVIEKTEGFDVLKEYKFSQVGPAALVKMLEAKQVEAIFDFEPFVSEAILATNGRYLLQGHTAFEQATGFAPWITNMVASDAWLKGNPKLAYAARDAYDAALKMMQDSNYEILRKDYVRKGLGITSDKVLDILIENARSTPYFTNIWTPETIKAAYGFLDGVAKEGEILKEVSDGTMVRLEEFVGPRP
ncbi:ABC transporter substrate-binding protein [Segnochrobactraceae bacterium EtOH-i3]